MLIRLNFLGLLFSILLFGPQQNTWAQDTSNAGASATARAVLEEIVVTARRRDEDIMTLPMSIQAITADAMEAQGILDMREASTYIPNVTMAEQSSAHNNQVVIRGIGGGSTEAAEIFGAALYIDGHYIPSRQSGLMSTLDVERIEVLRGPQGTLFGKNVTGGLVNIITARPGPEFESSITLRVAQDNQLDVRAMVNLPISDTLFARGAIGKETRDGFYYNRLYDRMVGDRDLTSFNGGLRWVPTDNWTFDLGLNTQLRDDEANARQCNPLDGSGGGMGGGPALDRLIYPGAQADYFAACADDAAQGLYVTSNDIIGEATLDTISTFLSAQWESNGAFGPLEDASLDLKYSTQTTEYGFVRDRDWTFMDIGQQGNPTWSHGCADKCGQDMFNESFEVIFNGQVNDQLGFTVGVIDYYEDATQGDARCRDRFRAAGIADLDPDMPFITGPDGAQVPNPANPDPNNGVDCSDVPSGLVVVPHLGSANPFLAQYQGVTKSEGLFGHVNYDLNDRWTLSAGTRYSKDERTWWNFESRLDNCNPQGLQQELGDITSLSSEQHLCTFQYRPTFQKVVVDALNNDLAGEWSDTTSMFSVTRHLEGGDIIDDGMIYALYSEGFLSGGFNYELNVAAVTLQSQGDSRDSVLYVGPENVANYELGFKGTFFDGRWRFTGDVFYMDYTDKQEGINIPNPDGLFGPTDGRISVFANVGEVDISGIELEMAGTPWDGGFLSFNFGYLKNEYSSFQYPDPVNPTVMIDGSNETIEDLIPSWTFNLGIEHQFTLGNGGSITPRLNVYSQDAYDFDPALEGEPASLCNQDAYTRLNFRGTYTPPEGTWRAALIGNNVTSEEIFKGCGGSYGNYVYQHERPAWWGIEILLNF